MATVRAEVRQQLDFLNACFHYKDDGNNGRFTKKSWRILKAVKNKKDVYGDCEDHSMTMGWLMSGKSTWKMYKNMRRGDLRIYTGDHKGNGHAVMWWKGYFTDNIMKVPVKSLSDDYEMDVQHTPEGVMFRYIKSSFLNLF